MGHSPSLHTRSEEQGGGRLGGGGVGGGSRLEVSGFGFVWASKQLHHRRYDTNFKLKAQDIATLNSLCLGVLTGCKAWVLGVETGSPVCCRETETRRMIWASALLQGGGVAAFEYDPFASRALGAPSPCAASCRGKEGVLISGWVSAKYAVSLKVRKWQTVWGKLRRMFGKAWWKKWLHLKPRCTNNTSWTFQGRCRLQREGEVTTSDFGVGVQGHHHGPECHASIRELTCSPLLRLCRLTRARDEARCAH